MNQTRSPRPDGAVVVGIGSEPADAALRWAVQECRTRQLPLHFVHAFGAPGAILTRQSHTELYEEADRLVGLAVDHARGLADGQVQVSCELDDELEPVDSLVRASDGAALVVLQHRRLGAMHRAFSGSLVNGVASRAHSSVVSVSEAWRADQRRRPVSVAIQEPDGAIALLRAGAEAAAARGTGLEVLHAWWLNSGFDVVVVAVDDAYRKEREHDVREWLEALVDEYREENDDVPIIIHVRHAPPLEAIVDAAESSDLLIVGRRRHVLPQGSHLGPVSRAVLDHTSTPVLVLGRTAAATAGAGRHAAP
jgi:nucleotide-binding universal stress UspA family protein